VKYGAGSFANFYNSTGTNGAWIWVKWGEVAASGTLTVAYREANTRLDRVLFTNDLVFTPSGMGGSGNSVPTISNITDQIIDVNGNTGALAFTVGDAETAPGSLTVSGTSTNTTLVPNNPANITFGGSGANRTITVTPAAGQSGTATITVTVSDGSLTGQDTFLLTVLTTISVSATDASAAEAGLDPGTFTFTRAGATAAALTVNYTVSGTATSGTDYTSIGASVAFAAGSATATKTVTPIQDTTVESTETVIVTLAAGTGYTVGTPNAATVNIADDDVSGTEVWQEAEGASGQPLFAPFVTVSDATASAGQYIHSTSSSTSSAPASGHASFTNPLGGTTAVWLRIYTPSGSADSFWVKYGAGSFANFYNSTGTNGAWIWVKWGEVAASGTLTVAYREANTRLDRVLFTNDLVFTPSGMGGSGSSPLEPAKIAIIGDSTVAEYPTVDPKRGWGQYIAGYFDNSVTVVNLANGGESTKTFIEEGRWANTLAEEPDLVLIQFGHNDSHSGDPYQYTNPATTYSANLRLFIDEARAAGATPVLITPMHRRTLNADGTLNDNLKPYADAMKAVAVEKNAPVIDLHTMSGDLYLSLSSAELQALAPAPPEQNDKTHFGEQGAMTMAELIMSRFPDAVPDWQPRLIP
jgi:lysophospholipase L1-like esterase